MKSRRSVRPLRQSLPSPDRYTVSGLVLDDICFTCECRIAELAGEEGMVLAWCECGWPDDAAEMEVLESFYFPRALIARRYGSAGVSGTVRIQ